MSRLIASVICVVSLCVASTATADFIEYGDFVGPNISYLDVAELTTTDGALYGEPELDGDSLEFPGSGFVTVSSNGGSEFIDGRLTLVVESTNGLAFNSIEIEEFGAFFTFGEGSFSFVNGVAFVETDDGLFQDDFQFTATGGALPDGGDWAETLTIMFPETTYAELTFDNQLFSAASDSGTAFIDKKGINIRVGVIPEPTSAAILGCGLIGLLVRRRR